MEGSISDQPVRVVGSLLNLPRRRPSLSDALLRDPVESVRRMDLEADRRPAGDEGIVVLSPKQHEGIEGIKWAELSAKWKGVVQALQEQRVTVVNPDHALEGALSIRHVRAVVKVLHICCMDAVAHVFPPHGLECMLLKIPVSIFGGFQLNHRGDRMGDRTCSSCSLTGVSSLTFPRIYMKSFLPF